MRKYLLRDQPDPTATAYSETDTSANGLRPGHFNQQTEPNSCPAAETIEVQAAVAVLWLKSSWRTHVVHLVELVRVGSFKTRDEVLGLVVVNGHFLNHLLGLTRANELLHLQECRRADEAVFKTELQNANE